MLLKIYSLYIALVTGSVAVLVLRHRLPFDVYSSVNRVNHLDNPLPTATLKGGTGCIHSLRGLHFVHYRITTFKCSCIPKKCHSQLDVNHIVDSPRSVWRRWAYINPCVFHLQDLVEQISLTKPWMDLVRALHSLRASCFQCSKHWIHILPIDLCSRLSGYCTIDKACATILNRGKKSKENTKCKMCLRNLYIVICTSSIW